MKKTINISGYLFIRLYNIMELQYRFKQRCISLNLLGSIVLSCEGINVILSGQREAIDIFYAFLQQDSQLSLTRFKESFSDNQPFYRLAVKRKAQLVLTHDRNIAPRQLTAPRITPQALKYWYDEGKNFAIIDTRNDYEYDYGSFDNAINPNIPTFRNFEGTICHVDSNLKEKPVVVFCTEGIRCEKASSIVLKHSFK